MQQLIVMANLESMNAELIRQGIPQEERLITLNKIAIIQLESLIGSSSVEKLENFKSSNLLK